VNVLVLEGGTSTSRATVVAEGHVVGRALRPGGARDRDPVRFLQALAGAAREALEAGGVETGRTVACGMLGSEWGLAEVPHVAVPAGPDELARGAVDIAVPELSPSPVTVIPGVRTDLDACRGEETAAMGLPASRLVFPGSHTKLVERDASGRIVGLSTSASGELVRAIAECTLPGAEVGSVEARALDEGDLRQGALDGSRRGLGFAAFQLRARRLVGRRLSDPLAYLMGAAAADEWRLLGEGDVWVALDSEWAAAWAGALRAAAGDRSEDVHTLDATDAAVRGALVVLDRLDGVHPSNTRSTSEDS
jgi:2-dehydro-3-deoxygalactonokinase